MGVITFNGLSSSDYGILVEHPPGYHTPERDYEYIHVPGRNGDLLIDSGSYKNGKREYDIAFGSETGDYATMANRVSEWLHSATGYARLEDTYEPLYFRMASYVDEVDVENILFHAGRATLEFNCKPQRYLKTGDNTSSVSTVSNNSITWTGLNPYRHIALPYIKVTATGTVTITVNNTVCMTISNVDGYIEIDSDIQNVYKGTTNMNQYAQLSSGKFPQLPWRGASTNSTIKASVASGETITKLEVKPRWWTL